MAEYDALRREMKFLKSWVREDNKAMIILVKVFYILFSVFVFPYYIINKIDFKSKTKKNPFYVSLHMRLASKYPIIYELSMYVQNFPYPTSVYNALPELKGKVLQIGCGTGLLNKFYRGRSGVEFTNLDINETHLKYGVRKKRFCSYILSDINKVPLTDGEFDMIVFARCFHHIKSHKKAFRECARLLKPEGSIIIADTGALAKYRQDIGKGDGYMVNSSIDGMLWRYTPESFRKRIENSLVDGLEIASVYQVRQPTMTNYNFKYPQTDVYAVLQKRKASPQV